VKTRSTSESLAFPVNQDWRLKVRRWLEDQKGREGGVTQATMARAAGISAPTLNGLLSGKYDHSTAVPLINKMVGLPVPVIASGTVDAEDLGAQLDAALASLDEKGQKFIREQAEGLVKLARELAARSARNDS